MKKYFITAISNQRRLSACRYETNQADLQYDGETAYPVMHLLANHIQPGDAAEVIAIDFQDNPPENFDLLKEDLCALERKFQTKITLTVLSHGLSETNYEHRNLFKLLVQGIEDCSTVYADLTYGTKPTPMVIALALFWIELIRKYTDVAQLIYGRIFWKAPQVIDRACIYDVTDILKIVNLTQRMEAIGGENTEEAIFRLLETGGEGG